MPFWFTCPYCFKKTFVSDELAGVEGPCVSCGKLVLIPAAPPPPNPRIRPAGVPEPRVGEPRRQRALPRWLLKSVCLGLGIPVACVLLFWVLWPSLTSIRLQRNRAACLNNLQRIAKALNDYAAAHGTYPPAVVRDAQGTPLHSWRVLILPYLGEQSLYARYDMNKPWNSVENSPLIPLCPQVYISPGAAQPIGMNECNYMLLTGAGTIFPPNKLLAPKDIRDGPQNTLLVVEVRNFKNNWTEPIDIDYTKLNPKIGTVGANTIGGSHPAGATAVFADGAPVWLPSDISPTLLNSIITPNGSEPVDATWLQNQ